MIEIDGSLGEGGGQIVRSSLSLSIITGKPFAISRIRANRQKPGLLNQHLTAVNAAKTISDAEVEGAYLGSSWFSFSPQSVNPGEYNFSIGTAGSTTLVFQTVLPPLMITSESSVVHLAGGTHNPMAPPFEFLTDTFLPLLNRMGVTVEASLSAYGFYPRGGGSLTFKIAPNPQLSALHLNEKGVISAIEARAVVVKLPDSIAYRELRTIKSVLNRLDKRNILEIKDGVSPGNFVLVQVMAEELVETFTALGERGKRAEAVAEEAAREAKDYLEHDAAVGEHLADQLLIPMALAGEGSFVTAILSSHTTTNIDVIQKFLDVDITTSRLASGMWKVDVQKL